MVKIMKDDGNGLVTMYKWVPLVLTTLTLISFIWGLSQTYAMRMSVEPLAAKVADHELRIKTIETIFSEHRALELERFARLESKVDFIMDRVAVMHEVKNGR